MTKETEKKIMTLAKEKFALSNFFHTYKTYKELQDYADKYTGGEKIAAHLMIMLTYNTMAFLRARQEIEKTNEERKKEIVELFNELGDTDKNYIRHIIG